MRVFLDANVLFSAAKSSGLIYELLSALKKAGHHLIVDAYVWEEAHRNIAMRYPKSIGALEALRELVEVVSWYAGYDAAAETLPLPEKDQPVLAAAIALKCNGLVTGDRTHFGELFGKTIEGVTIYSPPLAAQSLLT